jgi:hypothetical protein
VFAGVNWWKCKWFSQGFVFALSGVKISWSEGLRRFFTKSDGARVRRGGWRIGTKRRGRAAIVQAHPAQQRELIASDVMLSDYEWVWLRCARMKALEERAEQGERTCRKLMS